MKGSCRNNERRGGQSQKKSPIIRVTILQKMIIIKCATKIQNTKIIHLYVMAHLFICPLTFVKWNST